MAAQAGNGDPGDRADTPERNGEHVRHHHEAEESKKEPYTPLLGSYPFTVTPESRPQGRPYVTCNISFPVNSTGDDAIQPKG